MASVDSGRWLEYLRGSAALQERTLEQRWAVQDAWAAARGHTLRGTVRLVDPRTGDEFTAPAGSRFFYRVVPDFFYRVVPDPQRPAVVGVDTDANPEPRIEMRRLLQMGVDIPYR
jgi:hypothetical protein